jgi:hypothetical protein
VPDTRSVILQCHVEVEWSSPMDPVKSHDRPGATVVGIVLVMMMMMATTMMMIILPHIGDTTDCPVPTAIESGSS